MQQLPAWKVGMLGMSSEFYGEFRALRQDWVLKQIRGGSTGYQIRLSSTQCATHGELGAKDIGYASCAGRASTPCGQNEKPSLGARLYTHLNLGPQSRQAMDKKIIREAIFKFLVLKL